MIRNLFEKEEEQYIQLIKDILEEGFQDNGRNGNNLCIFGSSMIFSLKNNKIPLLTSKKLAWKTCLKELLWFIQGKTDNKILESQNVHIWDKNATRDFLDERQLNRYEEGDLGPVYGHQWRHFNAEYTNCKTDYSGKGIDQLQSIINQLKDKNTRNSRRIILTSWNPLQLDEMSLPPCHLLAQFNVSNNDELSCSMYQRSADVGLGVPFNIASYSFLTHILAKHCDLKPGKLIYIAGNCHIYDDHIEPLKQQINNKLFDFPTIEIKNKYENINDYKVSDFIINNYVCNEKIIMDVRA
jgi:thymidylate synthase